jgi:lysyl-tRNA synthetase class 2
MALRILGKASFLRLSDESGDFQGYLARDMLGVENYKLVKKLDVGILLKCGDGRSGPGLAN